MPSSWKIISIFTFVIVILLSKDSGFSTQLAQFTGRFLQTGNITPVLATWSTERFVNWVMGQFVARMNYIQITSPHLSRELFIRLQAHQDPALCNRSWLSLNCGNLEQKPGCQGSHKTDWGPVLLCPLLPPTFDNSRWQGTFLGCWCFWVVIESGKGRHFSRGKLSVFQETACSLTSWKHLK